jgi:hypothetical protein
MPHLPECAETSLDCPAVLMIERRLTRIDNTMDQVVKILTDQAVQASHIALLQNTLREHGEALSCGRDRFSEHELKIANLISQCDSLSGTKRWIVTTGVATLVACAGLVANIMIKIL